VTIDVDEAGMKFKSVSSLEVAIKIPSLLLQILPVGQEKAKEQGSAAVLKLSTWLPPSELRNLK
jgi:hypothetical protein